MQKLVPQWTSNELGEGISTAVPLDDGGVDKTSVKVVHTLNLVEIKGEQLMQELMLRGGQRAPHEVKGKEGRDHAKQVGHETEITGNRPNVQNPKGSQDRIEAQDQHQDDLLHVEWRQGNLALRVGFAICGQFKDAPKPLEIWRAPHDL